jgi:hypothetical protein
MPTVITSRPRSPFTHEVQSGFRSATSNTFRIHSVVIAREYPYLSRSRWRTVIMADIGAMYIDEAFRSLRGHKRLADGAIAQLSDEQFFALPDAESNSVAIIVKHMAGNMRSRCTDFLTTDGEKPDRHRDQEFIMPSSATRDEILEAWEKNWHIVFDTLNALSGDDLSNDVTIRGEPHTVLRAINRQVAHYSYHVGQIVFLAKHWKGSEWKNLSVPKGQSDAVNAAMAAKFKTR